MMKMNLIKFGVIMSMVAVLLWLPGCPVTNSNSDSPTQLTVGDKAVTAILEAGAAHWYKIALEAGSTYDFVFKHDAGRDSVGAVYTLFLGSGESQQLMWQRHYNPAAYQQLTNEAVVSTKQQAIGGFLAPESGDYFVSVEGYKLDEGHQPRNTYAYSNTLVYSISANYSASTENPQGEEVAVKDQASNVAYVTNIIEDYETVFHTVELKKGVIYQLQARPGDSVLPEWWNEYSSLSSAMYWMAPSNGTFYIRVAGSGSNFGYVEYGLRIQKDDHGLDPDTATELSRSDKVSGYLGQSDNDYFQVNIPGKPESDTEYKKYRVSVTPRDQFELVGLAAETDSDGNDLETYLITQSNDERDVSFSVRTTDDFDYLNDEPDGAGAYTISITAL